jgi:hypothetical protein
MPYKIKEVADMVGVTVLDLLHKKYTRLVP